MSIEVVRPWFRLPVVHARRCVDIWTPVRVDRPDVEGSVEVFGGCLDCGYFMLNLIETIRLSTKQRCPRARTIDVRTPVDALLDSTWAGLILFVRLSQMHDDE